MNKKYSKVELFALDSLIKENGHLTYEKSEAIASDFFRRTGSKRASGAIYMAAWRLENGYYDSILNTS